jgi:hypothetical protein
MLCFTILFPITLVKISFWFEITDKIIANEVDFVRGAQCEKEEIDGNFRETHKCVQGNMNEKARCLVR